MVRTLNPDCAWLGCDWDETTEPCVCGRPHTFRICARCLIPDDSETARCSTGASTGGDDWTVCPICSCVPCACLAGPLLFADEDGVA